MEHIKLGIIGLGVQGGLYTRILMDDQPEGRFKAYKPNNVVLGAFCDIDPEKKAQYTASYPDIPFFDDWKEMVDSGKVDAVITTVPHYLHTVIATYCLEHGMNVIVEKPAGVDAKHVHAMNDCALQHPDVAFGVMFNTRTSPVYQKVRELIQTGEMGEFRRLNWLCNGWYRTDSYYRSSSWRATWGGEGGGILVNQLPHQLDLWQWLVGEPKKVMSICVEGAHRDIAVENDVTIVAEYENGATGVMVACTHDMNGTDRLELDFSKGKIVVDGHGQATVYRYKFDESYVNANMSHREAMALTSGSRAGTGSENIQVEKIEIHDFGKGHGGVMENFADHILRGTPLLAPGTDGIMGVRLANAAQLSSWLNRPVEFPVDEELYLSELNKRIAAEGKFETK